MSEIETQGVDPKEVSFEEAKAEGVPDLKELLDKKAQEKLNIENIPGLHVLKKSKFYMNGDLLREHIATYKGKAIMLKQEQLKEAAEDMREIQVFPAIVEEDLLTVMKKVNGNVVRQINPATLHKYEKMAIVNQIVSKIDAGQI